MQIKITKGYRREAVGRYKHVATYVAIFPIWRRRAESVVWWLLLLDRMVRLD